MFKKLCVWGIDCSVFLSEHTHCIQSWALLLINYVCQCYSKLDPDGW